MRMELLWSIRNRTSIFWVDMNSQRSLLLLLEYCLGAPLQLMVAIRKEKWWRVMMRFLGAQEGGWDCCGFCECRCVEPPRMGKLIVNIGVER